MFRNFYNTLIKVKLLQTDMFKYLNLAKEYGKVYNGVQGLFDTDGKFITKSYISEPVFILAQQKPETYVAFYDNLYFVFTHDETRDDYIVRVYLKRPDDDWVVLKKDPNKPESDFNLLTLDTVKAEVYISYDLNILDLERHIGEKYKSDSWNKMFYKSLKSFTNIVESYHEESQIADAYNK